MENNVQVFPGLPADLAIELIRLAAAFRADPLVAKTKQDRKAKRDLAKNVKKRSKLVSKVVRDKNIPADVKLRIIEELFPT